MLPLEGRSLAEVAAALVGGSSDGHSGSALYLLNSMLNHSCEPSVDVQFADNSSRRAVTQLSVNTDMLTPSCFTSCRHVTAKTAVSATFPLTAGLPCGQQGTLIEGRSSSSATLMPTCHSSSGSSACNLHMDLSASVRGVRRKQMTRL